MKFSVAASGVESQHSEAPNPEPPLLRRMAQRISPAVRALNPNSGGGFYPAENAADFPIRKARNAR